MQKQTKPSKAFKPCAGCKTRSACAKAGKCGASTAPRRR